MSDPSLAGVKELISRNKYCSTVRRAQNKHWETRIWFPRASSGYCSVTERSWVATIGNTGYIRTTSACTLACSCCTHRFLFLSWARKFRVHAAQRTRPKGRLAAVWPPVTLDKPVSKLKIRSVEYYITELSSSSLYFILST